MVIYSLVEGEKTKSESTTCTKLWIMMNHLKERALQRIHNWGANELQREKPSNMIRIERKTKSWLQGLVECTPSSTCIMSLSWVKEINIMRALAIWKLCLHQSKLGVVGLFRLHTSFKILVLAIPFKLFDNVLCRLYMHNSFSWALHHNMKMVHKLKP